MVTAELLIETIEGATGVTDLTARWAELRKVGLVPASRAGCASKGGPETEPKHAAMLLLAAVNGQPASRSGQAAEWIHNLHCLGMEWQALDETGMIRSGFNITYMPKLTLLRAVERAIFAPKELGTKLKFTTLQLGGGPGKRSAKLFFYADVPADLGATIMQAPHFFMSSDLSFELPDDAPPARVDSWHSMPGSIAPILRDLYHYPGTTQPDLSEGLQDLPRPERYDA